LFPARSTEKKWAKTKGSKATGDKAIGDACHDCWETAAQGFQLMTWPEICDKIKASSDFKAVFFDADKVRQGRLTVTFRRQNVASVVQVGYKVSRRFMFLTIDEFTKAFGFPPKLLPGLHIDTLNDEAGRQHRAVIDNICSGTCRTLGLGPWNLGPRS
jgi:hypothetical protein